MLREAQTGHEAFLADYDTQSLHAADSMWVVRGQIDSPMGGGLAAFMSRRVADEVAKTASGEVLRFDALLTKPESGTP
jgi:nitrous oxide reductase accessory protein NosL